jgi:hypothetical protein
MSEPLPRPCPCRGSHPSGDGPERDGAGTAQPAVRSLAWELRRIRELVETRDARAAEQRIAELTREVQQLRETIARLRGSAASARGYRW